MDISSWSDFSLLSTDHTDSMVSVVMVYGDIMNSNLINSMCFAGKRANCEPPTFRRARAGLSTARNGHERKQLIFGFAKGKPI